MGLSLKIFIKRLGLLWKENEKLLIIYIDKLSKWEIKPKKLLWLQKDGGSWSAVLGAVKFWEELHSPSRTRIHSLWSFLLKIYI